MSRSIGRAHLQHGPEGVIASGGLRPLERVAIFVAEAAGYDLRTLVINETGGVGHVLIGGHESATSLGVRGALTGSKPCGGTGHLGRFDTCNLFGSDVLADSAERPMGRHILAGASG